VTNLVTLTQRNHSVSCHYALTFNIRFLLINFFGAWAQPKKVLLANFYKIYHNNSMSVKTDLKAQNSNIYDMAIPPPWNSLSKSQKTIQFIIFSLWKNAFL